jgi:hypothetical protein
MPRRASVALFSLAALALAAPATKAQDEHSGHDIAADTARGAKVSAGASGIILGTVAAPGINNRTLAEGYLTQPMVMAMVMTPRQTFVAGVTLNFEGGTLDRGELNAGVSGEGYIDRRHPHTLVHEVVGTGNFNFRALRMSVTAGKGFVPFGTDDPMSRPFVKYPVNHHLAQILERVLVSAAVSAGPLVIEGATFNGDEPESPYDSPEWDRFGDSWSARLTWRAPVGIEVQGSVARVESPELATGEGLDHRKLSASARYESRGRYALAEVARTREGLGSSTAFTFNSALAEASVTVGRFNLGARAERTERPEEERALNAFRTPRPHSDLAIIGTTRWTSLTMNASASLPSYRRISANPFVELSTQKPVATASPAVFIPADFYGKERLWSFSFGARLEVGMHHHRMGRYGAAQ